MNRLRCRVTVVGRSYSLGMTEARDIAEAESMRSRPGLLIPQDVIEAMMGADDEAHDAMAAGLDAQSRADLPPDSVSAMWEAVRARSLP